MPVFMTLGGTAAGNGPEKDRGLTAWILSGDRGPSWETAPCTVAAACPLCSGNLEREGFVSF